MKERDTVTNGGLAYSQRNRPSYRRRNEIAMSRTVVARSVADSKTEMCLILDVYDRCVHKGVCKGGSYRERNATQNIYTL